MPYTADELPEEMTQVKNVTPKENTEEPVEKKKPAPVQPEVVKPKLPDKINPEDLCKLGVYKDKPELWKNLPLDHLFTFRNAASNPEVLNEVLHFALDDRVSKLKKILGYSEQDLSEAVKFNCKGEEQYPDLGIDNKYRVFQNLKNIADKRRGQTE